MYIKRIIGLLLVILLLSGTVSCRRKTEDKTSAGSIISYSSEPESSRMTAASRDSEAENSTETEISAEHQETDDASVQPDGGTDTSAEPSTENSGAEEDSAEAPEESSAEAPEGNGSEAPEETEEAPESEAPVDLSSYVRSFGRLVQPEIAALNSTTLENKASGLVDITSSLEFTAEEVVEMIGSYKLPATAYYGEEPVTAELQYELLNRRELEAVTGSAETGLVEIRYGIITDNADVRSFPTTDRAVNSFDANEFDLFQESMLPIASGVLILHQTSDGIWSFVQGTDYFGWVLTERIGICDRTTYLKYLMNNEFAVFTAADTVVNGKKIRLGTVIPYEYRKNDEFMLIFPARASDGSFYTRTIPCADDGSLQDGFQEYSSETFLSLAQSLYGTAYGWGDTDENYDCSSTIGLLMRCFGIYMPRNTSTFKYFGGSVTDVSSMSREEKLGLISSSPGCILVMPGHAMIYECALYAEDGSRILHYVLHNTTGYYTDADAAGFVSVRSVTESALENMYRANGECFADAVVTVLSFDNNKAETAE